MKHKKGDRVGAVLSSNEKIMYLLGYGTYEGDFVPGDEVVGFLAEEIRKLNLENPRIKLDNGKLVYGCECWWGSEDEIRKLESNHKVILVDIDKIRAEYKEE